MNPSEDQMKALQSFAPQGVEINKAYLTGEDVNPATMTNGAALRLEFLAQRISNLTYGRDQMKFFNLISKMPSASTVAQYPTTEQHGESGHAAWDDETSLAKPSDPVLKRHLVPMKYASQTRQTTIPAAAANNISSPIAVLTDDAIVSMAKTIEQGCLYGDSTLSDTAPSNGAGAGREMDGVVKQIPASNVIDLHGADINVGDFNDAAVRITKAYGTPTHAFMPNGVLSRLNTSLAPNQRQFMTNMASDSQVILGVNVQAVQTQAGPVQLIGSNVMENDNILNETRLGGKGAPAAPVLTATPTAEDGGAFSDTDVANGATYKAVVFADKSGSLASAEATAAIANDSSVTLTIDVLATYQDTPQYVSIYRKGNTTGDFYLITRQAMYQATQVSKDGRSYLELTFKDVNDDIPETTDVFVGDMSPEVIRLYEFLPMFNLPLPSTNKMIQWSVAWSGGVALLAPDRWVHLKNVGYTAVYPQYN